MFDTIIKRNGEKVSFDQNKITDAILRAFEAEGEGDRKLAQRISDLTVASLQDKGKKIPSVEDVQDTVEKTLIEKGFAKIAKSYILYRRRRAEIRLEKQQVLKKDTLDEVDKAFDVNALRVLASRYLRKDDEGTIIETPKELFERVALHTVLPSLFYEPKIFSKRKVKKSFEVADEKNPLLKKKLSIGPYTLNEFHKQGLVLLYNRFNERGQVAVSFDTILTKLEKGEFDTYEKQIKEFYTVMVQRRFLPNTPALANFGNHLGMGSACFVLDVEDSIEHIMDTLKSASIIFKAGGGVGYNFSHLRPEGDFVKTTGGVASGPISFMSMFDSMTDVIKQGGIRRGANMGILNSNHPDILKFIKAKEGNKALKNFNISVLLTDDFWSYYENKKPYPLRNPRTNKVVATVDSQQLFNLLVYQAWESAEPGVLFADRINAYNPFKEHLGPIETTNPCGEVLLYPNESCNLGSINIWSFVYTDDKGKPQFDWENLRKTVETAVRFLDNVTDVNRYPLKSIEEMTLFTRKIGLGVMGVADALYELELPYNGKAGLSFMEKVMEFVNYHSKVVSVQLARERGPLPALKKSFYPEGRLPFSGFDDKKGQTLPWSALSKDVKKYGIRNGYTTVIAPTGSISMIAGCSSGIEPVYSLVFEKHVSVGSFYYVDPVFEKAMQKEGLMGDDLIKDVAQSRGSIKQFSYIPPKVKKIFVTAQDITPPDHIRALAAFQKWVDSSISKTNNFPSDATIQDVKDVYLLAYKMGCKGVTVYRDGSIQSQVLVSGDGKEKKQKKPSETTLTSKKDEKAQGLSVYSESSAHEGEDGLDLSPTLMSYEEGEDDIDFNGPVSCKLCNL